MGSIWTVRQTDSKENLAKKVWIPLLGYRCLSHDSLQSFLDPVEKKGEKKGPFRVNLIFLKKTSILGQVSNAPE